MKIRLLATVITIGLISASGYAGDETNLQTADATSNIAMQPAGATGAMEANKKRGEAFLLANKAKPGVVTLPDGLQYKIITAGTGPKPTDQDTVSVDYQGTLVDGTEFDSSAKHGGAAEFKVGQVIPGWVEALRLMPAGSTWELYIPATLAYGDQGAPPVIGPNEALIFKVTLVSVKK